MKSEAMSVINVWAEFARQTTFEDLPATITGKAERHILDTLGATLAGATSAEGIAACRLHTRFGQSGPAPIWGRDFGLSPTAAAFANGVAAHAFELDDTGGCDHSGPSSFRSPWLLSRSPPGRYQARTSSSQSSSDMN